MAGGFAGLFTSGILLPAIGSTRIGAQSASASAKPIARPDANELIDLEHDDNSENSAMMYH
jgi:hypothetical protein